MSARRLAATATAGRPGERGQAALLGALLLFVLVGMAALVIDGGYGFLQFRRAQNAADLASLAAASALQGDCTGGAATPNASISALIADLVAGNAVDAQGRWSGIYLEGTGAAFTSTPTLPDATGDAPAGACGMRVVVTPVWPPFVAQVLGVTSLSAQAVAGALVGDTPQGTPVGHGAGIVALAPSGGHTIWGGGAGQFTVVGNIMDDSTGNVTWTGSCSSSSCYADTVDDFGSSATDISGQLDAVAAQPLDPCFYPAGPTSATCPQHTSGAIQYAGGIFGGLPYEADPLAFIPAPTNAEAACPGAALQTFTAVSGTTLQPGVYTTPIYIRGNAVFTDCGGSPGIYIFQEGLFICPGAGQSVTGSDVMLYDAAAPPSGINGAASCDTSGTSSPGPGTGGPGNGPGNGPDGIYLGGQGTITLTGAATGPFTHMLLYQSRSVATNIGLDNENADGATIHLTGAIYNNSETSTTGPGGTGGVLVSGGGTGGGTITIDGVVVVDRFATAGSANLVITFDPNEVPGVGAVLVQ